MWGIGAACTLVNKIMEIEISKKARESRKNYVKKAMYDLREIPRLSCEELTYNQFYYRCMEKNLPVINGIKIR